MMKSDHETRLAEFEEELVSVAVLDYLVQQERFIPLSRAPQIERDEESGELFAVLDFGGESMRVAMDEGELPELEGHTESAMVQGLDDEYELLIGTSDSAEGARKALDKQLLEIVRAELDDRSFQKMVDDYTRQMQHRPKVKRNAPCPCGSGKKYKKCCMV